jgi:hypothetical protein
MLTVVDSDGMTPSGALIDEIVREGAKRMLAAALEAEVNACLAQLADQRDEAGRRLVVRNGYHAERTVATAAGPEGAENLCDLLVFVEDASGARSASAWQRRNWAQLGPVSRRGAGSMPAALRISQTVEGATWMPSAASSPWMRR